MASLSRAVVNSFGVDRSSNWMDYENPENWVTANGEILAISSMSDSHLMNAKRMLEDKILPGMENALSSASSVYGFVSGEMAEMCLEHDMAMIEEEISLATQRLDIMKAEIERRRNKSI